MSEETKQYQIKQLVDKDTGKYVVLHPETDASNVLYNGITVADELSNINTELDKKVNIESGNNKILNENEGISLISSNGSLKNILHVSKDGVYYLHDTDTGVKTIRDTVLTHSLLGKYVTEITYNDVEKRIYIHYIKDDGVPGTLKIQITDPTIITRVAALETDVEIINKKIPKEATDTNQLADKKYVVDLIEKQSGDYIGAFATYDELTKYPKSKLKQNDYAIVNDNKPTHSGECWRYKYTGTEWKEEYKIESSPFTEAQRKAINSGITSEKVAKYDAYETTKQDAITETNKLDYKYIKNGPVIDAMLDITSEHAIQNKTVTAALNSITEEVNKKQDKIIVELSAGALGG